LPISRRLKEVIARLVALEQNFLPDSFSLTGHYTRQETDNTKAYLLLVHGELESYFEDRAERIVMRARTHWSRHSRCTPVLSSILVYHHSCEKKELEPSSAQAVEKAINYFLDKLTRNHGITSQHLRSILLPLGIGHNALGIQLTTSLEQLSRKRGQFAHASFKAHQPIDPQTEWHNIHRNILPELKKLDRELTRLR
jgi:hypothetical protein